MRTSTRSIEASLAYLNRNGARVEYEPAFLSRIEATGLFGELLELLEFNSDEESMVRLPFSRERVRIPRRQTAYGAPGTTYRFSGCTVPARPWIPVLWDLQRLIRERTGFDANFVLVNHYRSGKDCVGWHSDDEKDLGDEPDILSLSLGATRDLQLRHKGTFPGARGPVARPDLDTVTLPLASGSLLVMRHPTNQNWKHRVPRRPSLRNGARLNLTWRQILRRA